MLMKKLLLFVVIVTAFGIGAIAQISYGGTPPSISYNLPENDIDRVVLTPLSSELLQKENDKYPKEGRVPFIGYSIYTDLSPENSGTWTELPDGSRVWRLQIKAPSALALGIYYDRFKLPYGSKLFLYNEDKTQILGAYTYENNDESGMFANEMVYGDIVCLEYHEPKRCLGKAEIHINEIAYFYRGVPLRKNPSWTDPAQSCEININCSPVGDNWQDEKRGVCKILLKIGFQYGFCTGSLVNNTAQDCTPYVLSAYHCYEGASATDLNQWIFYFNYEATGCTSPTVEPGSNTMTGCTLQASYNISGGSDMLLVKLKQIIPNTYNVYMNGWDRNNAVTGPGVGIHHPNGSIKKISTYNSATTSTYTGGLANAFWRVVWTQNANGWGVTEQGSSGSPLFDAAGRIVGTLTGGSSYCTAQSSPDFYGKMFFHWDRTGSTSTNRLKDWLDPTGANPTTLNGKYCNGGTTTLNADFTASATQVQVGQPVTFTSTSTGSPTTYSWNFGSGATPATANTVGPHTVTYSTTGLKTVTLTVGNGTSTDTETKTNYINVTATSTTCDTLNWPPVDTLRLYTATNNGQYAGYVSGNNLWQDKAKANYFSSYVSTKKINAVILYFGVGKGNNATNIPIRIHSNTGTGGAPGTTALATQNVTLGTIISNVTAQLPTIVTFTTPVTVTTPFYASVGLPTAAGDTISLYTMVTATNVAWEQWSDNVWYPYSHQSSWQMNAQLSIWPIMCPTGTYINELNDVPTSIYPNPTADGVNIVFPYPANTKVDIIVTDLFGRICKQEQVISTYGEAYFLDLNNMSNGIYILKGNSPYGKFIERITIVK